MPDSCVFSAMFEMGLQFGKRKKGKKKIEESAGHGSEVRCPPEERDFKEY